ncbi:methionyl-tRNA formyltransferase [Lawsonibacter sp. LCP25S3_G6]|uniref:methionyl-tRNA formyltransferase n=1 Tax=unclassified Lawsonibacter TaxID=2617946 RepID=UPI003F96D275
MRIVFMGTPDFAVPSLEALVQGGHEVVGVFSQPDKPVGRHQNKLQPTPVKVCAQSHDIPVYQPTTLRDGEALATLQELSPELIVVAAYGRVLPDEILALPPKGCINVHSSLLPKYRGAAPINWAVVNGDQETGVTIMDMAHELDAGDIIAQVRTPIGPDELVGEVHDRLAALGGQLLGQVVEQIAQGTARRTPQDPALVTYAPMLSRALSPIDWSQSAQSIHNKIRGLNPWPATSTDIFGRDVVKVFRSQVTDRTAKGTPGTILGGGNEGIEVLCGDGTVLRILELQAPGARRMSAGDYLRGHPLA